MTAALETQSARYTVRGIVSRRAGQWTAIEQVRDASDGQVLSVKLIEGPFSGAGAKRRAIQAAGTNEVFA